MAAMACFSDAADYIDEAMFYSETVWIVAGSVVVTVAGPINHLQWSRYARPRQNLRPTISQHAPHTLLLPVQHDFPR